MLKVRENWQNIKREVHYKQTFIVCVLACATGGSVVLTIHCHLISCLPDHII